MKTATSHRIDSSTSSYEGLGLGVPLGWRLLLMFLVIAEGAHVKALAASVVRFATPEYAVSEGTSLRIRVLAAPRPATSGSVTVQLGGTATKVDYTLPPGTVAFEANQTDAWISLTLMVDAEEAEDETIVLTLTDPTQGGLTIGTPSQTTIRVLDATGNARSAHSDLAWGENAGPLTVQVVRGASLSGNASLDFHTEAITATPHEDFIPVSGTLRFAPDQSTASIPIEVFEDTRFEPTEFFRLVLTNPAPGLRLTTPSTLIIKLLDTTALPTARYVSLESPTPTPPYTNWATAAHVIQQAVDAAGPGDEIIVTNGVYNTGGRAVAGTMTNRVAVTKPLTLRSINGPQFTIIQGAKAPDGGAGSGAIRCVHLARGSTLSGFTLSGGAADAGGGVWCASASEVVTNCTLTANSAGGGVAGGTVYNCTLTSNSGGGASGCTANNCTFTGNNDGGANSCVLNNCTLTGNHGAGANSCVLNNCTLTGNSGGGVNSCALNNCIVYFNSTGGGTANYDESSVLNYCCTTPLPAAGVGNITFDPQLASASRLGANSPCRGAGSANYAMGTDIDGEAWSVPPSIGCDEYHAGAVTGPLAVRLVVAFTDVAVDFPVELTAVVEGRATECVWEWGDGLMATNSPYATHAWAVPGDYAVVLRAYNDDHPDGVSATTVIHVVAQPVHYVAADSTNPQPPYAAWTAAAATIQDAVDAATIPGALVLVTNGTYATGGRMVDEYFANRVLVDKPLTLRSVNGPDVTVIEGARPPEDGDVWTRCVYLAIGAHLSGFTLTNGAATHGGGVVCESAKAIVTNCVLTANFACYSFARGGGGGAYGGTLNNCTLMGNWTSWCRGSDGGGALGCTLNNCTLTGNWAEGNSGGGAASCTLNNCTLTGNWADYSGGGAASCTLNNCTLTGNWADYSGGGASYSTLNNCIITSNSASEGGGVYVSALKNCTVAGNSAESYGGGVSGGDTEPADCALNNCIVYSNTVGEGVSNYDEECWWCSVTYTCTTPLPPGPGNIDADPRFVNAAGGDFRLRPDSPCIDTGTNLIEFITTDIMGLPRPLDGNDDGLARFDMGAYEFDPNEPFITRVTLTPTGLRIEWTATGRPARLQRTTTLTNPAWEDVAGSETTTSITVPLVNTAEFFRLVEP